MVGSDDIRGVVQMILGEDYITSSAGVDTARAHVAAPRVKDALTWAYFNEAIVPWSPV